MENLKKAEFIIVDVETTGLSPQGGDRIIEIAAVKVKNFEVVDRFESLIDPEREISYGAFLVNRISEEMLAGAPKIEKVLPGFLRFISDGFLVAHNAKFDMKFINSELSFSGFDMLDLCKTLDTIKMARSLLPDLERYSLQRLAYFLDIKEAQIHRAMADVEMTYQVFCRLSELAKNKGINTLAVFLDLFGVSSKKELKIKLMIEKIRKAISIKKPLKILYQGTKDAATLRSVTPMFVSGAGRKLKMHGFCHLKNEERAFLLEKIIHLEEILI